METPLIASLCYYGIVFAICELGRRLSRALVQNRQQLIFANEFFGTLQLCAMAFENGVILKHYGLPGFFLAIAASVIVHTFTLGDAYASPCPIFEQTTVRRGQSLNTLMIRLAAQLAAGISAFRLAKIVWALGLMHDHSALASKYHCNSDLHVPLLTGILFEMAATFIARLAFLKGEHHHSRWSTFVNAIIVPTIVLFGFTKTGMYFNPILAFSVNYGCEGVIASEHALVYWLGPVIGWILATEIHERTT